jgi:hypothetical protein
LKHLYFDFPQVAFWAGEEAENEFARQVESLKYRFLDLAHVTFWDGQEAENEFGGPGVPNNHLFLDLAQVAYSPAKRQKLSAKGQSTS